MKDFLSHFRFFYHYLGPAVYLAMVASMAVAILDGIGLTMFLPLLQVASGEGGDASEQLGRLGFILEWIEGVGVAITLVNILVVMLSFFILKGVARFLAEYYRVVLQQRFANKMRLKNLELLANYDYRAFASADSGRIQNTFSGEIGRITRAYRDYFTMLQQMIMFLVYVALAYVANPRFAAMVAIGALLSNFLFGRLYRTTKQASKAFTKESHGFQGLLIQSVASFKFLKATGLMEAYKRKLGRNIVEMEGQQRRIGTMNAIATALREPLVIGIVVVAILIQVEVLGDTLGLIVLSLLFFYRGLTSLTSFQNSYNMFLGSSASIANMEDFSKELAEAGEVAGAEAYPGLRQRIELRHLDYAYEGREVLRNVNLVVPKNKTVGIVGASGSGKTTLVNVLCGLLRVGDGRMFVDGKDINRLDLADYRGRVGYVTQEPEVFSDTIANNVSFWAGDSEEVRRRVRRALEMAHAYAFVAELPAGIDTVVGINGINLSGGQRQRISIARELYRDVDLLILDEATSALDSRSERLIQDNIESLSGSYTILVIAHRLSTVRKADFIVHLKTDGSYEVGTFGELLDRSPEFSAMVNVQTVPTS